MCGHLWIVWSCSACEKMCRRRLGASKRSSSKKRFCPTNSSSGCTVGFHSTMLIHMQYSPAQPRAYAKGPPTWTCIQLTEIHQAKRFSFPLLLCCCSPLLRLLSFRLHRFSDARLHEAVKNTSIYSLTTTLTTTVQ